MKSLGLLIILCLAGFFIYPLAAQRTGSECRALSRLLAAAPTPSQQAGAPLAARDAANRALPRFPPAVGCTWLYWHAVLNPPSPAG
jgi:hypothetical protein